MAIIKKKLKQECWNCEGKKKIGKKKCPTCKGSGVWEDEIYYFIDEKKKIAIDGDTLS